MFQAKNLTNTATISTIIAFVYIIITITIGINNSNNLEFILGISFIYPVIVGSILLYLSIKAKNSKAIYLSTLHIIMPIVIYVIFATLYTGIAFIK